jgi:gliding motility-associated-like protein
MRKIYFLIACSLVCCLAHAGPGQPGFRENAGQVTDQYGQPRSDIRFQLTANGLSIFIGKGNLHYQWNEIEQHQDAASKHAQGITDTPRALPKINSYRLDVTLLGANQQAAIHTEDVLPDVDVFYTNALAGVRAHAYRKITFRDIYPNIDWVFYCKGEVVKYDFVVHPGGKVSDIRMRYDGAKEIAIKNGALVVATPMGSITEQKPYSYTAENGLMVPSGFKLNNNTISFDAGDYSGTLVIDPELRLEWSTYYGGAGTESGQYIRESQQGFQAYGQTVITDNKGTVYMSGTTQSADNIATTGTHQHILSAVGNNAYLVKFTPDGQRAWATYFGGRGGPYNSEYNVFFGTVSGRGHSIACDTLGNIYMTGNTYNDSDIATPGAYQASISGTGWPDLYLVKFNSSGNREWSTYFGNPGKEEGGSVAVTPDGSKIYLTGASTAYDAAIDTIASGNAFIPANGMGGARYSGFLACFNTLGQRQWGTYIGDVANITSTVYDIALDREGYIFLTGYAIGDSPNPNQSISSPGSHQPAFSSCPLPPGPPGGYYLIRPVPDAFIQKWDSTGNRVWGTYYGGSGLGGANAPDGGYALACDDSGNVYMTGFTSPFTCGAYGQWTVATQGSFLEEFPREGGGFLVKFSGSGQRQWGTYYYGDYLFGNSTALACKGGNVFLLINTYSDSLATPCAYQTENPSIYQTGTSLSTHLSIFNRSGQRTYASYFGGKLDDWGSSLAIDSTAEGLTLYIAGTTFSPTGIASPGSFKSTLGGQLNRQRDAFLSKFLIPAPRQIIVPCFSQDSIMLTATDTTGSSYEWNNGTSGHSIWVNASGSYVINYLKKNGCPVADTFLVTINPLPLLNTQNRCKGEGVASAVVAPGNTNTYTYNWSTAQNTLIKTAQSDRGDAVSALNAGSYRLQILADGCDTTIFFNIEELPGLVLTASSDTLIAAGSSIRLWASGALTYQWSPEQWLDNHRSASPVASPREPVTYTVTGFNEYGCHASLNVHIDINENIFMPNAFSPNGDGINDVFKAGNYGYHKISEFRVFNRWGEEVFYTVQPDQGWDGYCKGQPADIGIYHYYIRLQNTKGLEQTFKGDVTLIR